MTKRGNHMDEGLLNDLQRLTVYITALQSTLLDILVGLPPDDDGERLAA